MRKLFFLCIVCLIYIPALSQFIYQIKADSVRIHNDTCNAELILENGTRNVNGFLYNKGNGRTEFRKALIKVNDSLYLIGADSLKMSSSSNSSGNAWLLTGNNGTDTSINFIGTTDNVPLNFRVNNQKSGFIDHLQGNVFLGYRAGKATTGNANNNVFIGDNAGAANATGYGNTFTGYQAGLVNNTGFSNVFIGDRTGLNNTTGHFNTFLGHEAGVSNTTGNFNTFLGNLAGRSNTTGILNIFVGDEAGMNSTTGNYNLFMGYFAGVNNASANYNHLLGYQAGHNNTASSNQFEGFQAGYYNSTGAYNYFSGFSAGNTNTTGSGNTIIGFEADVTASNLTNAAAIGYFAEVDASNKIVIGNSSVGVIGGSVSWSTLSDGRFKKNILEDVKGLDFILKLRPVTYNFDLVKLNDYQEANKEKIAGADTLIKSSVKLDFKEKESVKYTGLIAQEVEQVVKETGYDFSGVIKPKNDRGTYAISYSEFVMPLIKSVQELQKQVDALKVLVIEIQKKIK